MKTQLIMRNSSLVTASCQGYTRELGTNQGISIGNEGVRK